MKACLYCVDMAHSRTTVFWSCKVTTNNGQASQFFVLAQFQRLDSAPLESEPGFMPIYMYVFDSAWASIGYMER